MADLKDLAEQYGVLKDKLNAQDFEPNDSVIVSSLMHPQEAAGRASDWLQEKMRIASGRPYEENFTPDQQAQAGLDLAGLMQTGAMPFAPASSGGTLGMAIKAYHGSPHKFKEFDMSKIGTGEGAQAYGRGLYFAENPLVADDYLREFKSNKNKDATIYETNLKWPDENKEKSDPLNKKHFIDYKKDISKQSQYVQDALENARQKYNEQASPHRRFVASNFRRNGEDALKLYGEDALLEAGIPGVRYLDEGSRVPGKKTHNLVLFSDEYPEIIKRAGSLDELQEKYAQGGAVDKDSLQLNKPQRTPSHPNKSHIVKTMVDGKEKIIRFGEQGAETAGKPKEGESDRMTAKRESFKARHAKNIAKGKSSAAYWANKVKWAEGGEVDLSDDNGYADDLARLKRAYENSNFGPNDSVIASSIRHPAKALQRAGDWLQEKERILSGRPYEDDFTPEQQTQAALDLAGLAETGSMPFAPISAGGTLGTVNIPEKTVKAYKLFRTKENDPDTLYPLFVNADKPVPFDEWVAAEAGAPANQNADKVKSLLGPLAYRPGWHAGDVPVATHIGKGGKPPVYRPSEHTWAEVEFPNDVDWQTLANERGMNKKGVMIPKFAHITDQLPEGGFYRYKTSPNMTGQWLIGGSMKLGKNLSDEEVKAINEASGLGIEDLPRFHEYLSRNADNPEELARVINSTAGKNEYFHMLKSAKDRELDDLLKQYEQFTDAKALKALDARYNKYLKKGYACACGLNLLDSSLLASKCASHRYWVNPVKTN